MTPATDRSASGLRTSRRWTTSCRRSSPPECQRDPRRPTPTYRRRPCLSELGLASFPKIYFPNFFRSLPDLRVDRHRRDKVLFERLASEEIGFRQSSWSCAQITSSQRRKSVHHAKHVAGAMTPNDYRRPRVFEQKRSPGT